MDVCHLTYAVLWILNLVKYNSLSLRSFVSIHCLMVSCCTSSSSSSQNPASLPCLHSLTTAVHARSAKPSTILLYLSLRVYSSVGHRKLCMLLLQSLAYCALLRAAWVSQNWHISYYHNPLYWPLEISQNCHNFILNLSSYLFVSVLKDEYSRLSHRFFSMQIHRSVLVNQWDE